MSHDETPTLQQFLRNHTYRHWTPKGRFLIEPKIIAESPYFELSCDKRLLGTYMNPQTASEELYDGKHDEALGFSAKDAGVPPSLDNWNGLT